MHAPAFPALEDDRLCTLDALYILDTPEELRFDRLTRLAARSLDVPIALVSLIDSTRQWFKSRVGLDTTETPRSISFCGHAILQHALFVVPDAKEDERFADNPLVKGAPHIRFYAGCPLMAPNGHNLGTLCVIDTRPRQLDQDQLDVLHDLAAIVTKELCAIELNKALALQRESEQTRNRFFASAVHELRTPMASILGFSELLLKRDFDEGMRRDLTERIFNQTGKLVRLVNQLLDLARTEASKESDFNIQDQNLNSIIEQTILSMLGLDGIWRVRMEIPTRPSIIPVDKQKFQQALTNILGNSLKYASDDSIIHIVVEKAPAHSLHTHVVIRIKDAGIGMTPEQVARIFEHFYRANPSSAIPGTGLGMSIVKEIIEAHGGTIEVESQLGVGTEVVIHMPLHKKHIP